MLISYAIPVCNEHAELEKLLLFLTSHIDENDEIIVQCDQGNTTPEVYKVLYDLQQSYIEFPLKGHFSNFKNNLKECCIGDWIFQIDADELPHEGLITNLKDLLKLNPTTEMFLVPRVNTVRGLTQEHINKWRWNVDEKGWVNWPDYQGRIWRNRPNILWKKPVHEVLTGYKEHTYLPMEEEFCFYHPKDIDRQEKQNEFYSKI